MPEVKCVDCENRIFATKGGMCTKCSGKSGYRGGAMGPREYLVERAISSVHSIVGKERMSAILEHACMLLEAHEMTAPFVLKNGRIDSAELYQTLQDLVLQERMEVKSPVVDHTNTGTKSVPQNSWYSERVKEGHLDELPDNIEFLLVEKRFTIDDSQIGRKMVHLVRALNCHIPRDIRRLARSRSPPPSLRGP